MENKQYYKDFNNPVNIIESAYREARSKSYSGQNIGTINNKKSATFIELITKNYENLINEKNLNREVMVFSRKIEKDNDFKLSEFLYDVHLCEFGWLVSHGRGISVKYITKSLLQLESEMNTTNSKNVILDFSKLVCGNAGIKIMIIAKFSNQEGIIGNLSEIAKNIIGDVYLFIIDKPNDWGKEEVYFKKFKYSKNEVRFKEI